MIVCKAGHIHYLFLQNLLIFKHFNVACLSRRGYDIQQSSKTQENSPLAFLFSLLHPPLSPSFLLVEFFARFPPPSPASSSLSSSSSFSSTSPILFHDLIQKMHLVCSAAIILGMAMATALADDPTATTPPANGTANPGPTKPDKNKPDKNKPDKNKPGPSHQPTTHGTSKPNAPNARPNVTRTTNDTKPDEAVTPKPGNPTPKPNTPKKGAAGAVEYGYGIIVMPAILLIRG